MKRGVVEASEQLKGILLVEPLPVSITFLYFGLYDAVNKLNANVQQGFYVGGGAGSNPKEALEAGDLSYLPRNRYLRSCVLDSLKAIARENPDEEQVVSYLVTFGAAAILAKHSTVRLGIDVPIYVGFDSGDFALVANRPESPALN